MKSPTRLNAESKKRKRKFRRNKTYKGGMVWSRPRIRSLFPLIYYNYPTFNLPVPAPVERTISTASTDSDADEFYNCIATGNCYIQPPTVRAIPSNKQLNEDEWQRVIKLTRPKMRRAKSANFGGKRKI